MNADLVLPLAADLLLKSSAVLAVTWLALKAWRQASAGQRACVWCVAFGLVALLPLTRLIAPHWVFSFGKARAPVELPLVVAPTESNVVPVGEVISVPAKPGWEMPDGVTLGVGLWLAGMVVLAGYRMTGTLLLQHCRRTSLLLEDELCAMLAENIRGEFGIARRIELRVSRDCRVPVTWGTWRPVVLLPAEALEWPREWIESALRHELAHVRNCDHMKRLAVFFTCAVYWPNPLMWMAAKQLQLAQEEASDNLVLRTGFASQDYAAQLVDLIRLGGGRRVLSLSGVAMARPSTLEGRLAALLDETRNRGSADGRWLLVGTGVALLVGLALGAVQLRAAEQPSPGPLPAAKTGVALLQQKLKSIVIDRVDFNKADVAEVIQFLQRRSTELDPDHQGINFVLRLTSGTAGPMAQTVPKIHTEVTLDLASVPMGDVLDAITRQTNLQYSVEDYAVYLRPAVDDSEVLSVRTYLVPASLRGELLPAAGQAAPENGVVDVKTQLSNLGFLFPSGATATFLPGPSKLVVRDTVKQLDALVELMAKMSAPEAAAPKRLDRIFYLSDKAALALQIAPGTQGDVSGVFEKRGIDFPAGTKAVLLPNHQLEAANLYPEMKKLEALLMAEAPQDWHSPAGPGAAGAQEPAAEPSPLVIGVPAPPDKAAPGSANSSLNQKLAGIILSLDFNDASLEDAVRFLSSESKRLDPGHQGVSFVINLKAVTSAKRITLTLANVSVGDALNNICAVAHVKFSVQDYAIVILAATEPDVLPPGPPAADVGLAAAPKDKPAQAIMGKLKALVVPRVSFTKLDVAMVLQLLAAESRQLDPDKKGINFVLGNIAPGDNVHREVSVTLDNVPMEDLLGYITQQTNLQWSIMNGAVFFAAPGVGKPPVAPGAANEPPPPPVAPQGASRVLFVGYQRLGGDYIFRLYLTAAKGYEQPPMKKSGEKLGFADYTVGDFHPLVKDEIDPATQAMVKTDESTLDLIQPAKGLKVTVPVRKEVDLPE